MLYFKTKLGTLYQGDAGILLADIYEQLDQLFDLCLTDPPYGINEAAGKNKSRSNLKPAPDAKNTLGTSILATDFGDFTWDQNIPDKNTFDYIFRVARNQIIFGGNYFVEYLKGSPCWLVWDKVNGSNDFADAELAWTSFETAVRIFKYRWNGMLQPDMKNKEKRYHPTQKPVGLFELILSKYSREGDYIIDPFAGSGTTAIACEKLGRRWVLIEREEKYCEIAAKRIEKVASQMKF